MGDGDRLLTMDEVAEQLRLPVSTLRYWRHTGQAPPAIKIGRRVLFSAADLDRWIAEQREAG